MKCISTSGYIRIVRKQLIRAAVAIYGSNRCFFVSSAMTTRIAKINNNAAGNQPEEFMMIELSYGVFKLS